MRPQEAPGGPRRPQEAPGGPRRPQEASASQPVSHSGSQRASLVNPLIRINNDTNGNTPSYNQSKITLLKQT